MQIQPTRRQSPTLGRRRIIFDLADFDGLPDSAQVSVQAVAGVLGRSVSSVWRDARAGTLPAPVKTGPGSTRWNVGAIRRHLASLGVSA